MLDADVIVIGGGLAGLVSAIDLSKAGLKVMLIEKTPYPNHKVCGEYLSNEIIPYLHTLGIDFEGFHPINRFEMSTIGSGLIQSKLGLGGIGISRHKLDNLLYIKALESQAVVIQDTVTNCSYVEDHFIIKTKSRSFQARLVLGAYGKRSNLDITLKRNFISKKSGWLAVKAHYRGSFPDHLVGIYHFKGGYCGVSKVESDILNICYLVNYESFKLYKDIAEHRQKVLYENLQLKSVFEHTRMLFDSPLTISQISFDQKSPVDHHVLMIGDAAGLIHPMCGNGMGMAIQAAQIASDLIKQFFNREIKSHYELEKAYSEAWKKNFNSRIKTGRLLSWLFKREKLTLVLVKFATHFPFILPYIIKRTHGKPLNFEVNKCL